MYFFAVISKLPLYIGSISSCAKRKFTETLEGDKMKMYFRAEHGRGDGKEGGEAICLDQSTRLDQEYKNTTGPRRP